MSNIRNSISLTDRMTPTLRSIMKAMDSTLHVMEMVNKQANMGISSKAFKQAEKDIRVANNALIKMGNYAELGNSKVQRSTQKSIQQMNILEAAAYGVSRAMSKIGQTPLSTSISARAAGIKNFSLSDKFNSMQARGMNMMNLSNMLGGTQSQAIVGGIMRSVGALGSGVASTLSRMSTTAGTVFSRIGSGATTAFNIARNTVTSFATSAGNAMNKLSRQSSMMWQSVASGIYVVKSVMSALSSFTGLTDKVTSDVAKLNVQNYSDITSGQAYGLTYQAARASRSDISATSNLASRISMSGVYGNQEGSLESSINMAETIQKALAVGGGTPEENSRAILQLSQGLSSGVLQGDELRSIREQSPYLADMLAQGLAKVDDSFIGTTAGDLKELGSQGRLTSEVVIKAFEAMEDQINQTFEDKAPKTWGQGVTSVLNTIKYFMGILQTMESRPLQKITNLIWTIADYLQSAEGMQLLAGIAVALGVVGDVLSFVVSSALNLISWLMDNSWMLIAIFTVLGIVAMVAGISAFMSWIAAIWPLLLIIAVVAMVIAWVQSFGVTTEQIVGAIAGSVTWFVGLLYNSLLSVIGFFKGLWAALGAIWDNIGIGLHNLVQDAKNLFWELAVTAANAIADILKTLNKIPGVNLDGAIDWAVGKADEWGATAQAALNNKQDYVSVGDAYLEAYRTVGAFEEGWSEDWFNKGYNWGADLVTSVGDMELDLESMFDPEKLGASLDVDSVSVDGGYLDGIKSDVNISDEDIKLLRDATARDYLLQLQTVTPVAHVTFGDVRETADVGKIVEVIEQMVDEQMATALVS